MRIYISGAIRGCTDTYPQTFARAQKYLEEQGHIVINPAVLPTGLKEDRYMPICLAMIDGADAIFMLSNWERSRGASLEKAYAEYQGKVVLFDV